MEFSARVKQVLRTKIQEMAAYSWLYVRNPGRNFTRDRKLNFETTLQCLITMGKQQLAKGTIVTFSV